ncbi:hypothetical protein C7S20_07390 [Christiangramia fulva]|uniref:Uncharacterized protein n=1 Tax=Christiangramia fulva TaxID=2126553 RepID=A0A2R3Z4A3_9FLAO|nr:hypothetical protein [Christiangramia fulva]AVR45107.1 hypothetical protein C7S20_07390 [Christiangramia fulva]
MKFKILVAVFSFGIFVLTSCTDTVKETTVVKETKTENKEGILERSAKKVDAEVNKEIDNKIEEIGDDN